MIRLHAEVMVMESVALNRARAAQWEADMNHFKYNLHIEKMKRERLKKKNLRFIK